MIAGVKINNMSCDPDHDLLGMVCHPKARISYSLPGHPERMKKYVLRPLR